MTGNRLFQSKISVSVFKVEIYILKQVRKSLLHLLSYYKKYDMLSEGKLDKF